MRGVGQNEMRCQQNGAPPRRGVGQRAGAVQVLRSDREAKGREGKVLGAGPLGGRQTQEGRDRGGRGRSTSLLRPGIWPG